MALGILLSRILGLVRERFFAFYLGNSDAGDAFRAALRIPNILQNLLGEGVLSASFIPVYARLEAQARAREAETLARAVFAFLLVLVSLLVALGLGASEYLADWLAPGFAPEKRALTVELLRIVFPGTGFLVLSAWCLGVLNSHHRFFLAYAAPVVWNLALIGALALYGDHEGAPELVRRLAWAFVVGSLAQFAVQLPSVWRLARFWLPSFRWKNDAFRRVLGGFGPVLLGRGVVQISAYVDTIVASLFAPGSLSILVYAQTLATLPLSLFGMSVSAAELPQLSRELATGQAGEQSTRLRERLAAARRRVIFFIAPTSVAFVVIGDSLLSVLYRGGAFGPEALARTWPVLAAYAFWLPASTVGRLYSSALFAAQDTRTPPIVAIVRVALGLALSGLAVFVYRWGFDFGGFEAVTAVVAAAAVAGGLEASLLRRRVIRLFGALPRDPAVTKAWLAALVAGLGGFGARSVLSGRLPGATSTASALAHALLEIALFAVFYAIAALALKVPEAQRLRARLGRRGRGATS